MTCSGASRRRRRRISRRRPDRASRSIMRPREARRFRSGCRSSTGSPPSGLGARPDRVDAGIALARVAPNPGHQGSAGFLARLMGGGEVGNERPLPAPSLARRSRRRRGDHPGEAAGQLSAALPARSAPPDAGILKFLPRHFGRVVDIAQIDHDGRGQQRLDAVEVERAEFVPFGDDDEGVGLVGSRNRDRRRR